nr:immunoglobulin heavy chain junction region [Macaca mulatta]MOW23412.1 immunoglobulin heavy chain junction region [Macaca mulatta]MOW23567.1 immunoglobulin heavy chain junction region [Macaca mulatta]MOW23646.1 immunoglobulin heavy chain junction region [Macaca mulatta]MOW23816.1 immunoglobulin heavy chain junction region [Macaca mulatta]
CVKDRGYSGNSYVLFRYFDYW